MNMKRECLYSIDFSLMKIDINTGRERDNMLLKCRSMALKNITAPSKWVVNVAGRDDVRRGQVGCRVWESVQCKQDSQEKGAGTGVAGLS